MVISTDFNKGDTRAFIEESYLIILQPATDTGHGKDCRGRKKVQRHWKTKFKSKCIVESTNLKSKMF